tara:strand:- start:1061 stop:10450 length:9390 start_codon:yes stop_codon:yes gene_type:complete
MAEMKRNFTAGKMNKDFDERIVPMGEYRDAMNIQVSTSEGSDIGTIQNILGNKLDQMLDQKKIAKGSKCIGSIADEKNGYIYWFTAQDTFRSAFGFNEENVQIDSNPEIYVVEGYNWQGGSTQTSIFHSDFLTKKRKEGIYRIYTKPKDNTKNPFDPVFVDDAGVTTTIFSGNENAAGTSQRNLAINEGYAAAPQPVFPFVSHGLGYNMDEPLLEIYDGKDIGIGDKLELWGIMDGKLPFDYSTILDNPIYVASKKLIANWTDNDGKLRSHYEIGLSCSNINQAVLYTLLYSPKMKNKTGTNGNFTSTIDIGPAGIAQWQDDNPGWEPLPSLITHINFVSEVLELNPNRQITGINIIDDMLFWTDGFSEPKKINISRSIKGTDPSGNIHTKLINEVADISPYDSTYDNICEVSNIATVYSDRISLVKAEGVEVGQRVTCENAIGGVCDDLKSKHVTVLEIDPDGTDPNEVLISEDLGVSLAAGLKLNFNWDIPIRKDHVTVIKHSPKSSLDLQLNTGRDIGKSHGAQMTISPVAGQSSFDSSYGFTRHDFGGLNTDGWDKPGNWNNSQFVINIELDEHDNDTFDLASGGWAPGKDVVIRQFNEDNTIPHMPISGGEYVIRGTLTIDGFTHKLDASPGSPANVQIIVKEIVGAAPVATSSVGNINFLVDIFTPVDNKLFEFKFPRFSYRYKYEDGEYSTFAPFTQVAFLPGNFDYHAKKGYNLGMTNRLLDVKVRGFISQDMPKDVTEIDILYKDDKSPEIYVVETIRPNDESESDISNLNAWDLKEFTINNDTIHAILPENQVFRHYDNVPKTALAQEIIGNRLVYGNYTQGYNLTTDNKEIAPKFKHSIVSLDLGKSIQSVKSLRDYKLGVVFVDRYGRETPVVSNKSAEFRVDKSAAKNKNKIKVGFKGSNIPNDMEYFKFFIKETSSEYYNLAMGRFYETEDDNVWLAFQSSDRDKIDIDTYLILKKGIESNDLVAEEARYKVLAIEAEAPDSIKTETQIIGKLNQDSGTNILFIDNEACPLIGGNTFECQKDRLFGSSLAQIHEMDEELSVEFHNIAANRTSKKYEITSVGFGDDAYSFTIDGFFEEEDLCGNVDVYTGACSTPQNFKAGIQVRFYKSKVKNSAKFDGMFFVKIFADQVFNVNIANSFSSPEITDYNVIEHKKVYYLTEFSDSGDKHSRNGYKIFDNDNYWKDIVDPVWFNPLANTDWDDENDKANDTQGQAFRNAFLDGDTAGVKDRTERHFQKWRAYFKHNVATIFYVEDPDDDYATNQVPKANPKSSEYTTLGTWQPGIPQVLYWKGSTIGGELGAAISFGENFSPASQGLYGSDLYFNIAHDSEMRNFKHETDNKLDGYEDVVFLDAGTHVSGHIHGTLDYGTWWTPFGQTTDLGRSGFHSSYGIENFAHGLAGRMDIGIGPIFAETDRSIDGEDLCHWGGHGDPMRTFWRLTNRSEWEDTKEIKLLKGLEPGIQFRWSEDPNGQVYTISEQVGLANKIRFSTKTKEPNEQISQVSSKYEPYTYTSENYTRNRKIVFEPAMSWDPTNGGIEGIIPGGREINTSYNGTATATALIGGFSGNIIRVDETMFDDTIDTTTGELFNINASTGLGLTRVENGTCADTDIFDSSNFLHHPLVVTRIELDTQAGEYVIFLGGYNTVKPGLVDSGGTFSEGTTLGAIFTDNPNTSHTYTLTFQQLSMNGLSVNSANNINNYYSGGGTTMDMQAVGYTLQIVKPVEEEVTMPENPAIWETEPKDDSDLDIYYEISENFPIELKHDTIDSAIPIGSLVKTLSNKGILEFNPDVPTSGPAEPTGLLTVTAHPGTRGNIIRLSEYVCVASPGGCVDQYGNTVPGIFKSDVIKIVKPSGVEFGVKVRKPLMAIDFNSAADGGYNGIVTKELVLFESLYNSNYTLDWYNCFAFGNGVESNRIRDSFNRTYLSNGVKASTTLANKYKEEHREAGLIYSGIYNSTAGINNLNQFIVYEKITKDINPIYGSIQKLHARDEDLVTLCENKILKILANKDALFNADGNPQLVATANVLGQAIPFVGEYGISKNPESFVSEAYRAYFSDQTRGVVLRLSKDGLTPISDHGMRDWFRDNLKLTNSIIGSYDDKQKEYNITLKEAKKTLSFREDVRGWVSFKSFIPENGISCSNNYYTFKGGRAWVHHDEHTFNTFYDKVQDSHVTLILNENPGLIKSFKTLNYEGTQSRVIKIKDPITGNNLNDGEYYNSIPKKGWFVDDISTNKQKGSINEFIEKEGKWFNYIKGKAINTNQFGSIIVEPSVSDFDQASFAMQGLGTYVGTYTITQLSGCTDAAALNYNPNAVIDDGSCIPIIYGCMDVSADNYSTGANTDDGSCAYGGCTDPTANNYDPTATYNNGSCWYWIPGCIDSTAFNYDPTANQNDPLNPCYPVINGCMESTASNYTTPTGDVQTDINTEDGTCVWYGCTIGLASNYVPFPAAANAYIPANQSYGITEDGSCSGGGCMDNGDVVNNLNYSGSATSNQDWWVGSPVQNQYQNVTPSYQFIYNVGNYPGTTANNFNPNATWDDYWYNTVILSQPGGCDYNTGCTTLYADNYDPTATIDNGSCIITGCLDPNALNFGCSFVLEVQAGNVDNANNPIPPFSTCNLTPPPNTTQPGFCVNPVPGCMDSLACNYNHLANTDDGSCDYSSCAGCITQGSLNYNDNVGDPLNFSTSCYVVNYTWTAGYGGATTGTPQNVTCTIPCGNGIDSTPYTIPNCCNFPVSGCTDPNACNYDPAANQNFGCDYSTCSGCLDSGYFSYCSTCTLDCAGVPNGSDTSCCGNQIIVGCMDPDSCIFDPNANTPPSNNNQPFYNPNISPGDANEIKQGCIYSWEMIRLGDDTNNSYPQTTASSPAGVIAPYYYESAQGTPHSNAHIKHYIGPNQQNIDAALRFQYKGDADTLAIQLGHPTDNVKLELEERTVQAGGVVQWSSVHTKYWNNPLAGAANSPGDLTNGCYYTWGSGDADPNNYEFDVYTSNSSPVNVDPQRYRLTISDDLQGGAYSASELNILATVGTCYIDNQKLFEFPWALCNLDPNATSGCTDDTACNYDSTACTDDGSCIFAGLPNPNLGYNCVNGSCVQPTACEAAMGIGIPTTYATQSACQVVCGGSGGV